MLGIMPWDGVVIRAESDRLARLGLRWNITAWKLPVRRSIVVGSQTVSWTVFSAVSCRCLFLI